MLFWRFQLSLFATPSKIGAQVTAINTCKSRVQAQVRQYAEPMPSPSSSLHGTFSLEIRSGRHVWTVALANGSLDMWRDFLARWDVWYLQQAVGQQCIRHSHKRSTNDIFYRKSCMPDTSSCMVCNTCFTEMCVESSTRPLVCSVSLTELCV